MANCKACNTRVPENASACPHCGHAVPKARFAYQGAPDTSEADPGDSSHGPLSPSNAMADPGDSASASRPGRGGGLDESGLDESGLDEVELGDEVELPLDDAVAMAAEADEADPAPPVRERRTRVDRRRARRRRAASTSSPAAAGASSSAAARGLMSLSPDQLRHLVGEQPDLLEPGLRVLGEEGRRRLGDSAGAELEDVDLLARGAGGDWVIVQVVSGRPGPEVVPDVLRAVGWVRKHLCEADDSARAIVLLEHMDEELGYAAAAVGDTIAFRTWRISVEFEPVEP